MKIQFLLFIFFNISLAKGQSPIWEITSKIDAPITSEIIDDKKGFLWFTTSKDLCRYDGDKVQYMWNSTDPIESFTSLCYIREEDRFLVGSSTGNLWFYQSFPTQYGKVLSTQFPMSIDHILYFQNTYYAASYGVGLYIKNDQVDTLLHSGNLLASNEIYDLEVYNQKIILASDLGLHSMSERWDIQEFIPVDSLSDIIVTHVFTDDNQIITTDFNQKIDVIKNHEISHFTLPIQAKINDLIVEDNTIYVATNDGLFHIAHKRINKIFPEEGKRKVDQIYKDIFGTLWIYSEEELIRGNLVLQNMQLDLFNIQALVGADEGFWLGTDLGLYHYNSSGTRKVNDFNVTSILAIDDYLILGTYADGILIIDRHGNILDRLSSWHITHSQSVLAMETFRNGFLVSTLTGLAYGEVINQTLSIKKEVVPQVKGSYIYDIHAAGSDIYLGLDRQGLAHIDSETGGVSSFSHTHDGEKIGSVFSIAMSEDGTIWFSNANGSLFELRHAEVRFKLQSPTKKAYSSIINMKGGFLVLNSDNHLKILNPLSGLSDNYVFNKTQSNAAPFLNNFYQKGSYITLSHENNLYQIDLSEYQFSIPNVSLDGVWVNLDSTVNSTFKQNENNISFQYSGIHRNAPTDLFYHSRLIGLEDEPRITKDKEISFAKLPPGKYRFEIGATAEKNSAPIHYESYSFVIHTFFYNTWWFRLGLGIVIGILVWKWFQIKERNKLFAERLEKKNIEAKLIHLQNQLDPHFLFNSFNTLIGLIEENPTRGISFTEKMTDFYRSLLSISNQDLIPLTEEMKIADLYMNILQERFEDNIQYQVHHGDFSSYLIPPLAIQSLLENAIKHNSATSKNPLIIRIILEENILTVTNNLNPLLHSSAISGIGNENLTQRFILNNMKKPQFIRSDLYYKVVLTLENNK